MLQPLSMDFFEFLLCLSLDASFAGLNANVGGRIAANKPYLDPTKVSGL